MLILKQPCLGLCSLRAGISKAALVHTKLGMDRGLGGEGPRRLREQAQVGCAKAEVKGSHKL